MLNRDKHLPDEEDAEFQKSIHEELGLHPPEECFVGDEAPRPPDRELIAGHLDGSLDPETDEMVAEMLVGYRDWAKECMCILQERRAQAGGDGIEESNEERRPRRS